MSDPIEESALKWRQNPDADATLALCVALRGSEQATLMDEVAEAAKGRHAAHVGVLVAAARMYMSVQRFSDAQGLLVTAGKVAPREGAVYRALGEVLLRRGDAERAEKVLERALQFGGGDSETRLWLDRAKVFKAMQQKAGSRAVAAEVERTAPASPPKGRAPMESFSDSTTTEVRAAPQISPGTGPMAPDAAGSAPLLFGSAQTPPPRYPKDVATASLEVSPRPPGLNEDSVTFDLSGSQLKGPLETQMTGGAFSSPTTNGAGTSPKGVPHAREVLDALALAGVFEPPSGQPQVVGWDRPHIVTRRRGSIFLVVMTFLFAGSVIGVFTLVRQKRAEQHQVADANLTTIEAALRAGNPGSIPAIEETFKQVFDLDSRSPRAAMDWLRERALVGLLKGGADLAFEDATTRAREVGLKDEQTAFAQLASFLFQGDTVGAAALLSKYDGPAANDPWYQLLAGATLERAGDGRALERYAAAARLDPDLFVAQVALARATAIEGDPQHAGDLARALRARYPDRIEGSALVALAWARNPARTEQPPPEANEIIARASELPVSLTVVPHAIGAIRALDNHSDDDAKAAIQKGLAAADGPGVATWLGSIALATDDEALARRAALIAVSFSAVYPPARVLAARVALLGDRLDEALKATEELDAASPDVAIVRGAAAYERGDADGLGRALDAISPEARKLPVMAPLVLAEEAINGRARLTKDKLVELAGNDAPWSDLVAMDIALDYGELETAQKIADDWKASDKHPLRAERVARLARYQGKLDDADAMSLVAMQGGTVTPRVLIERSFVLVARKKESEVGPLLAKYPLVLGPLATWLSAYAVASAGRVEDARAKTAALDAPPDAAAVPARVVAAAACGKLGDRRRGYDLVKGLLGQTLNNPDVTTAGAVFGLRAAPVRR